MRRGKQAQGAALLTTCSTENIEALCGSGQNIRPCAAADLEAIELNEVMVWCVQNGVYQVPTLELIDTLRKLIDGRSAVEICAGNGSVGRALGIPTTDSYVQEDPQLKAYHEAIGQPITVPGEDVERLEAMEAVRKYKPEVVLGTFVTHKWNEGNKDGSVVGVDEPSILRFSSVKRYIVVGNTYTHRNKPVLRKQHQEIRGNYLVSRATDQSRNRIFVWDT